jgi:hypothetical protein
VLIPRWATVSIAAYTTSGAAEEPVWRASLSSTDGVRRLVLGIAPRASWTDPVAVVAAWVACAGAVSIVTMIVWWGQILAGCWHGALPAAAIMAGSLLCLLPTVAELLRSKRPL